MGKEYAISSQRGWVLLIFVLLLWDGSLAITRRMKTAKKSKERMTTMKTLLKMAAVRAKWILAASRGGDCLEVSTLPCSSYSCAGKSQEFSWQLLMEEMGKSVILPFTQ